MSQECAFVERQRTIYKTMAETGSQPVTPPSAQKVIETIILGFVKKAGIAGDDTVYGGERGDARQ